jgi:hypothetical protein
VRFCAKETCKQDLISSKLCQLITTLCAKQQVAPDKYLSHIIEYLIEIINTSHSWQLADSLRALSYVLAQGDISLLSTDQVKNILESTIPNAALTLSDLEVRRQSINVFASICQNTPIDKKMVKFMPAIFTACYRNFEQWSKTVLDDIGVSKHLKNVLRALTNIITAGDKIHVQQLEDLTSRLSTLIFYGTKLVPISNKPRSKTEYERSGSATSDSETSDNELTGANREALHIRIQSLQLLIAAAHRDFKSMFGQWSKLFPTDSNDTLSQKSRYITTAMIYDTSSRCRGVAASCIGAMLERSKMFLAQADDEQTKSAFMPFSHTLAATLRQLHIALLYAIENENSTPTLCQLIKCLTNLVDNVPYAKLTTLRGYLPKMLELLRKLLSSPDKSVTSAVLQCIAAIFGNQQCMDEVGPFALEWVKLMIDSGDMIVIASAAKNYIDIMIKEWDSIKSIIRTGISHYDQNTRLTAIQMLVNLTQQQQQVEEEAIPEHSAQLTQAQQNLNKKLAETIANYRTKELPSEMWQWILYDILNIGERGPLRDSFHNVRIGACTIIGSIPAHVIESLPNDYCDLMITEMLSIARSDQLVSVRAQAYRSLGLLVSRTVLPIINTSLLSYCLKKESNINVKVKIAWLIANYCERVDQSSNNEMRDLLLEMSSEKKLTSSAVRALGTLTPDMITYLIPFIKDEDVKVRWNACFAVGRLGVGNAIEPLCEAICTDENFKVRIQAAAALALTKDYGSSIVLVWKSLLVAFTNPQSLSNFKEYRYLKILKDQLQDTLCHVIDSMSSADSAAQVMIENVQVVSVILQSSLHQQNDKESINAILSTIEHAAKLYNKLLETNMDDEIHHRVRSAIDEMLQAAEHEH